MTKSEEQHLLYSFYQVSSLALADCKAQIQIFSKSGLAKCNLPIIAILAFALISHWDWNMGTTMSSHPNSLPPRIPCQSTNSVEGTSSGRSGLPLLHETSPILSSSDSSRVVVDLFSRKASRARRCTSSRARWRYWLASCRFRSFSQKHNICLCARLCVWVNLYSNCIGILPLNTHKKIMRRKKKASNHGIRMLPTQSP